MKKTLKIRKIRYSVEFGEFFILPSHMARKHKRVTYNGLEMILDKPFKTTKRYINATENQYITFNYYKWKPLRMLFTNI